MIKVFMNDGSDFLLDLQDEEKEIKLVYKFMDGLSPNSQLKINTAEGLKRIPASSINNMQFRAKEKEAPRPFSAQERMDAVAQRFLKRLFKGE